MALADLILNRSKQRRKLLSLFFANESKEFYLRDLERITGIPVGNIRRELNRLQQDRLFTTRKQGNLLFYQLNSRHPHYGELKRILAPVIGLENAFSRALKRIKGIDVAFLYGSIAAKRARSDSDVDLIVVGSPDKQVLLRKVSGLEKELQREINYKVYERPVFDRKKEEENSFLMSVLQGPKIFVIGDPNDL